MGKAKIVGGGGGLKIINAYIEMYKAQEGEIDAGMFVEFVNSTSIEEVSAINGSTPGSTNKSVIVALSSTKAIWSVQNTNSTYYRFIQSRVLTFDPSAKTISIGSVVEDEHYAGSDTFDLIRIDDTRALFVCSKGASTTTPYARVFTVSGTSISRGTIKNFTDTTIIGMRNISVEPTDTEGEYLVVGNYDTTLYNIVIKVSGTTVSIARAVASTTKTYYPYATNKMLKYLGNNTYAMLYVGYNGSSYRFVIDIVQLTSTTITQLGSLTLVSGKYTLYQLSPTIIDDTHLVVGYGMDGSTKPVLYLVDITGGTPTKVSTYTVTVAGILGTMGYYNPETRLLYVLTDSSTSTIYGIAVRADYSMTLFSIWSNDPYIYNGMGNPGIIAIPNTIYLYVLGSSTDSYSRVNVVNVDKMSKQIQPYVTKVDGVTKTKCTAEKAGKVYIPLA